MDWSPSRAQHSQTITDSGRGTEDLLGEARVAGTPQRTGADLVSPAVKRMSTMSARIWEPMIRAGSLAMT